MIPVARPANVPFRRGLHLIAPVLLAVSGPAAALDLALPEGAVAAASAPSAPGAHRIATGAFDGTQVPATDVTGMVRRTTWQIPEGPDRAIATLAASIADQLGDQGYRIALDCADRACGGFDFVTRLDMGQAPEMFVDIGAFHYLAATGDTPGDAVAVTVSEAGRTLYVHVVQVGAAAEDSLATILPLPAPPEAEAEAEAPAVAAPVAPVRNVPTPEAIARLAAFGAVPLDDLRFRTGASELTGEDTPSLVALAAFLAEDPDRRVILVGHTDAVGSREANIAVSRARAEAVRQHLIESLDVDPAQLEATGIGYLAPRATNETAEGREANRRVEAVLLGGG